MFGLVGFIAVLECMQKKSEQEDSTPAKWIVDETKPTEVEVVIWKQKKRVSD